MTAASGPQSSAGTRLSHIRDKLRTAVLTPVRAMRLRYLPLLMIYYAYGALGLVTIAQGVLDQGSADLHAGRARFHRRLADAALDHQDGVRPACRFRAGLRLAAPRLCLYRREPRRHRARHSCRRRRRLDHLRRQERALRHRPASHRHRRRPARRGRRRHDHGGRRSQAPRRHPASVARSRARAWPRAGPWQACAVVRHPLGRRALGLARADLQLRDRVPARADRAGHLRHRRHPRSPRRREPAADRLAHPRRRAPVRRRRPCHRPWRSALRPGAHLPHLGDHHRADARPRRSGRR